MSYDVLKSVRAQETCRLLGCGWDGSHEPECPLPAMWDERRKAIAALPFQSKPDPKEVGEFLSSEGY